MFHWLRKFWELFAEPTPPPRIRSSPLPKERWITPDQIDDPDPYHRQILAEVYNYQDAVSGYIDDEGNLHLSTGRVVPRNEILPPPL